MRRRLEDESGVYISILIFLRRYAPAAALRIRCQNTTAVDWSIRNRAGPRQRKVSDRDVPVAPRFRPVKVKIANGSGRTAIGTLFWINSSTQTASQIAFHCGSKRNPLAKSL